MGRFNRIFGVFLILCLWGVNEILAQSYLSRNGYVEFLSEAPQEDVLGKSNFLVGRISLTDNEVDFYVDARTLKTGITYRDEHLQENYIETDKFPYAEFFGSFTEKPDPSSEEVQDVKVEGNFKVHGVENPVTIIGTVQFLKNGNLYIKANWPLQLSDYDIPIPKVLNYRLSNDLTLTVDIILEKRSQ
jgi:hypothetical protein